MNLLPVLKRYPAVTSIRAYAGDDDEGREIAVPTRRRKWAQVIAAIESAPWSRLELLDAKGRIVAAVDNETDADIAPAPALAGPQVSGSFLEAERIVSLVLRAQDMALKARDAEHTALLRAQGDVVREMVAGMRELAGLHREQLAAAHELADTRVETVAAQVEAAARGEESGDLKQFMEAMPVILQALPLLRSMLGSGASPAITNGVKG